MKSLFSPQDLSVTERISFMTRRCQDQLASCDFAAIGWSVFCYYHGWLPNVSEEVARQMIEATYGQWLESRELKIYLAHFGVEPGYGGLVVFGWRKPRFLKAYVVGKGYKAKALK